MKKDSWLVLAFILILFEGLGVGCSSPSALVTPSSLGAAGNGSQIRIIAPRDNAIVPAGANTVQVSLENLAPGAAHAWHLYLDGVLINTLESGVVTTTVPISESGPHEIKATLTDSENVELASSSVEVTAAPETPTSSPFNLPWVAPAMAVFVVGVLAIIAVALRITRRKNP